MDRSKIPPIKVQATFYPVSKERAIEWLGELQAFPELELKEFKYKLKSEAVEVIEKLYEDERTRNLIHDKIIADFPKYCGIGPSKVEEILQCTRTERKRWEDEGKLLVVEIFNSGTSRNPIWVPMYSRKTIESLNDDVINRWRADHEGRNRLNEHGQKERVNGDIYG